MSTTTPTLFSPVRTPATRSLKLWRKAFVFVYSMRAFSSMLGMSHTIVDVEDDGETHADVLSKGTSKQLAQLVKDKDLAMLEHLGGIEGLLSTLATNADGGVSKGEEDKLLGNRRDIFGSNAHKKPPVKGFISFVIKAMNDPILTILFFCGVVSLSFGLTENGLDGGWYEGASIFLALLVVISVKSIANFRQYRRFTKLSDESSSGSKVDVVRKYRREHISVFDVVVGDVVFLKIGDRVPADGVFLGGHSLELDESNMTGETAHVAVDPHTNPFLSSGTKVVDGYGSMVVTAVGMNTTWGEMMSTLNQSNPKQTPLQERLEKLATNIGKIGTAVALVVLIALSIRYFAGSTTAEDEAFPVFKTKTATFKSVLTALFGLVSDAVTIIVVTIPEGLPMAVTLTLAYSMNRMMLDKAMVREQHACETMGSVTTICTDKTGTLTLNQMVVVKSFVGDREVFVGGDDVDEYLLQLFRYGVGLNTTGSIYRPHPTAEPEITASPTEKAILSWAVRALRVTDMKELKRSCVILHVEAFNYKKKRSGVLVKMTATGVIHVHWKGAAEMILAMCSTYHELDGSVTVMDSGRRIKLEQIIQGMAADSLRCIAFAYKRLREVGINVDNLEEEDLTLLGIVGLKDPCRPEVPDAVKSCRNAGVAVKMITGDNIFTARAIALESGILKEEEQYTKGSMTVIEGKTFRECSEDERMEMVDVIRVMARSSPIDKLLMVQCLKKKGEVVAVTGDGTNDAPALKEADVGLSMGIQGTEVAKECSDIIILDDNFKSVVTVISWGRCVNINIQKFIQFQLTVNIAALVINFIAAIIAGKLPLTTVQLLWVNMIMNAMGALALATERPTRGLMKKPPVGPKAPLITNVMWRNLASQAIFQIGVLLAMEFNGRRMLNVSEKVKTTMLFNTFVFCQVFNEFNARKLKKKNVFQGLHMNKLFLGIICVTVALQFVMVEHLQRFAGTTSLNLEQWGICIGIAFLTWPIGFLVKCIPVSEDQQLLGFLNRRNKTQHRTVVG